MTGKQLQELRERRRKSRLTVADEAGVHPNTVVLAEGRAQHEVANERLRFWYRQERAQAKEDIK